MHQKSKQDRTKIIKNTLFLYFRMGLVMIVSFFTTRVTLQILGVEDFGIQNVVAGIVSFLGILTSTMTSATQRFFSYDLGRNDLHQYRRTFSTILVVFMLLSVVVLIVGEILGPWLIKDYLVIPRNKLYAAYWTYQLIVIGSFYYNNGDNLLHNLIVIRMEINDNGELAGNNRTTDDFQRQFNGFLSSNDLLIGRGDEEIPTGNSGYKVFIYRYGLIN